MALLLKNDAIFLHVPKTGGNWVRMVLRDLHLVEREIGHKHADLEHLDYKPSFTFCFVRCPLRWYESWFKYQARHQWLYFGNKKYWHPCRPLNGLGNSDFNEFMKNVLASAPGYISQLYAAYTDADFVGKQERLVDNLINVLDVMSIEFDEEFIRSYGPVGASSEMDLTWDRWIKQAVVASEREAILEYGYEGCLSN